LDKTVYRYASLAEMLRILRKGEWDFPRPEEWPDKYEQHVSAEFFGKGAKFHRFSPFLKCLSFEYSSEAMWRTYASASGLVRMSWKLRTLLEQLSNATLSSRAKLYVAQVRYMRQPDLRAEVDRHCRLTEKLVSSRAMNLLLMKRSGFSYENEIRFCFMPVSSTKAATRFVVSNIDGHSIGRILLDPYLPEWQATQIQDLLKNALGFTHAVTQSIFNAPPKAI
jgi:hypothetical protein